MKKTWMILILLLSISFSSYGQFRWIQGNGESEVSDYGGAIGEILFSYRSIYGRYPNDKAEVLSFHADKYQVVDYGDKTLNRIIAKKKKKEARLLKDKNNVYTVFGDTCSFHFSKQKLTLQCVGGVEELLHTNYDAFRRWCFSLYYNSEGRIINSLSSESPSLPQELCEKFHYFVMITPHYPESDFSEIREGKRIALIPFSLNRSGEFKYDYCFLEGAPLFFQEYGKNTFGSDSFVGEVSITEAIDANYVDIVRSYMEEYMEKHPEVAKMRLWEALRFNNTPSYGIGSGSE